MSQYEKVCKICGTIHLEEIKKGDYGNWLSTAQGYVDGMKMDSHYGIDCWLVLSDEEWKTIESRHDSSENRWHEKETISMLQYEIDELVWIKKMALKYGSCHRLIDEKWTEEWRKSSEEDYLKEKGRV